MKMKPIALVASLFAVSAVTGPSTTKGSEVAATLPTITVYKDPSCGCCKAWIEHLRKQGFHVIAKDTPDMSAIKQSLGVPSALRSCHTAVVAGYLVEGHVPAPDIKRMLKQKPRIAGLAVPGMPAGSPGMEGPAKQPYSVVAFTSHGTTSTFSRH